MTLFLSVTSAIDRLGSSAFSCFNSTIGMSSSASWQQRPQTPGSPNQQFEAPEKISKHLCRRFSTCRVMTYYINHGLYQRTVFSILRGVNRPHPLTPLYVKSKEQLAIVVCRTEDKVRPGGDLCERLQEGSLQRHYCTIN